MSLGTLELGYSRRRSIRAGGFGASGLTIDFPLLLTLLAVTAVGFVVLYSAVGTETGLLIRQATRFAVAFAAFIVFAQIPPRYLRMWTPWLYIGVVALLIGSLVNLAAFVVVNSMVADLMQRDDHGMSSAKAAARHVWTRRGDIARGFGFAYGIIVVLLVSTVGAPLGVFLLVFVFFFSVAPALQSDSHIEVDMFDPLIPARLHKPVRLIGKLLTLIFATIFFWYVFIFYIDILETDELSFGMIEVRLKLIYWIGPIGTLQFLLTAIVLLARFWREPLAADDQAAANAS